MPTAPAIRFLPNGDMPDREIVVTYEELVRDITRTANFLRSLGVAATDTVALLTPNIPQAQVCLWAAQTAGIACPINFMLEPVQIASIIRETERSDEHTSELQSLMRISYAVFCLKK